LVECKFEIEELVIKAFEIETLDNKELGDVNEL
jgi:hypothetical protein